MVWTDHLLFIHLSVDGHGGCVCLFALVVSDTMDMGVTVSG